MTDGVCTGVVVETKGGTYNITADAVVVATGGFCNNKAARQIHRRQRGPGDLQLHGHHRRLRPCV